MSARVLLNLLNNEIVTCYVEFTRWHHVNSTCYAEYTWWYHVNSTCYVEFTSLENQFLDFFLSGRLIQVLLYSIP